MPQRIRAYTALAEERYNLPVYPVLINILPNSAVEVIPEGYKSELMGIKAAQDYRVINLWEVEASLVFREGISSLLPFVPILKGGGQETVVRQALQKLRAEEKLSDLEPLLSFFASFVLEIPVVQQIMRWDMTVLRESPWYQEILKEGLDQGRQEGWQEGRQEGRQEEGVTLILRQLTRRVGELNLGVVEQIRGLNLAQLEELAEALLEFKALEDLLSWLEKRAN
jgi:predicted transposase YdaD